MPVITVRMRAWRWSRTAPAVLAVVAVVAVVAAGVGLTSCSAGGGVPTRVAAERTLCRAVGATEGAPPGTPPTAFLTGAVFAAVPQMPDVALRREAIALRRALSGPGDLERAESAVASTCADLGLWEVFHE